MAVNFLMTKVTELEKKLNNVSGPSSGLDEETTNRIAELAEKLGKLETSNTDDKLATMEQTLQVMHQKNADILSVLSKKIEDLEKALDKEKVANAESSKQLNSKINALEKKLSAPPIEPTPPA